MLCLVTSVMSDSVILWTVAHQAPLPMEFCHATLNPYSLPSEPPGKPKNNGVGSLSLLQGIFLTQELSSSLLYCRQIHYQLNHQGSLYINMNHFALHLKLKQYLINYSSRRKK